MKWEIELSEGTLTQRGKTSWRAAFYYTDPITNNTERVYATITDAATKRIATKKKQTERSRLKEEIERDLNSRPKGGLFSGDLTLKQYIDNFTYQRRKLRSVEGATIKKNITDSNRLGWLLDMRVCDITEDDIARREIELMEHGYAPQSVKATHVFLKQVLAHATRKHCISENPMLELKPPKVPKSDINALSNSESKRMTDLLDSLALSRLTVAIRILKAEGMRRGETCGLKWRRVDFGTEIIHIRDSIGGESLNEEKGPKNDKFRDLPMAKSLVRALLEWRKRFPEDCGEYYVVGSTTDPNAFMRPDRLTKEFALFAEMHGFDCTAHDLRHTFATKLLSRGVDVVTVAYLLGDDPQTVFTNYAAYDFDAIEASRKVISALA